MIQNVYIAHLKHGGSQPAGVTTGGVLTHRESPHPHTHCAEQDQLSLPSNRAQFIP